MKPEPDFGADFAKAMKAQPEDPGRSKDVKKLCTADLRMVKVPGKLMCTGSILLGTCGILWAGFRVKVGMKLNSNGCFPGGWI